MHGGYHLHAAFYYVSLELAGRQKAREAEIKDSLLAEKLIRKVPKTV